MLPEGADSDEVSDGLLVGQSLPRVDLAEEVGADHRRELALLPVLGEVIAALREELPRAGPA